MTAFIGIAKNRNLSFIEVESLINLFDQPILLVDQDDEIALVNSALIELIAFTKQEVIRTPLRSLIVEERSKKGKIQYKVLRKNRSAVEVELKREFLDDNQRWKIYSIIKKNEQDFQNYEELKSILHPAAALMETREKSFSEFCEKGLNIFDQVFHFDLLSIYVEHGEEFLLSDFENQKLIDLPEKYTAQELKSVSTYHLWQQGNRAINQLQRSIREQHINTLIVQRFHTEKNEDAILIAGWGDYIRDDSLIEIVEEFMGLFEYGTALYEQKTVHTDIESDVERTRKTLQSLTEAVDEGVIYLDGKKGILEVNQNMEKLLGYSQWEAQALDVDSYLVSDPKLTTVFMDTFEERKALNENFLTVRRRDGGKEPVRVCVIPLDEGDSDAQFIILVKSTREVDGLKKNLKELEHQAVLGNSVARFAHEVRNPINNMMTGLQTLQSLVGENETQTDMITRMMNDCMRLNHLMDSILSYAKPIENNLRPINLDLLVKNAIEKWDAKLARNNVKMVYQCEENLPEILGDLSSLERVFINLISNAVDAMKKQNGGTLAIKIEKENEKTIDVNVSDTGPGIPEEILKNLFTPFVSFSLKGTGLGLAISKEIIAVHKGEISVESFPGGTVFHISLPIKEGE